jgi:hypothetical protein
MKRTTTGLCGLVMLAGAVFVPGCPVRFETTLKVDDSLRDKSGAMPSVEVHLIGINDTELKQWQDRSVSDYWRNVKLDPEVYVMKFGEQLPNPRVLTIKDPIWDRWDRRSAMWVVVLSSHPAADDKPGDSDMRRKILPRDPDRWAYNYWGKDQVTIVISKSRGLEILNPPKPK